MTDVLVTGGAGYIGSHAAKALQGAGYRPVVLDNLSTGFRELLRWGDFVEGDFGDRELLSRLFRDRPITAVMHFGADKYVDESMENPSKYFDNNVRRTLVLLEEMKAAGIGLMVFSSTAAVYGDPAEVPVTEETPADPLSPYADSKLMIERVLHWYGKAHGLRWLAPRYFNAAGADPDGETGSLQKPATHLIQIVIEAAAGERDGVSIFGTDYDTADGTPVRDFVHVTDLAEAHVIGLGHLEHGGAGGVINLGTGRGHTVREVIAAVERVSGRKIPVSSAPRRPGDVSVSVADAGRARALLGWSPRFASLDDIVATAWRWENRDGMAPMKGAAAR